MIGVLWSRIGSLTCLHLFLGMRATGFFKLRQPCCRTRSIWILVDYVNGIIVELVIIPVKANYRSFSLYESFLC